MVIAYDGQPCQPHPVEGGRLVLGPAMRVDLILDMQGEPGRSYRVIDDFYPDLAYKLLELASDKLEVAPEDLLLADGEVRAAGVPTRSVSIVELTGEGTAILCKGSGVVPANPPVEPGEGCLGRLGFESFLEP